VREIKFRQMNKNDNKWHYWGYVDGGFTMPLGPNQTDMIPGDQYIGIKDKNDKEIFQSDTVKLQTDDLVCGEPMPHETGTIIWLDGRFVFLRHDNVDNPIVEMNECLIAGMFDGEAIANTTPAPELLKQKEPATT